MQSSSFIRALAAAIVLNLTIQPARAQSAAEFMAKGDAADASLRADEALQSYLSAEKLDPDSAKLMVKIARQYRHLMADAKSVPEKLRLGQIALTYGHKAAALGPNDSDAQLSTAITYGKMLPYQGKKEQVEASPRIKAAVDRAIKLDPRNDTAWHVLGRWHQALANVSGVKRAVGGVLYGKLPVGTNEKSIECFEKAIAINPGRLRHYIEEGRTYAQMGDHATAKRFLKKGLAMPNEEKDDPELKQHGREALAKLP